MDPRRAMLLLESSRRALRPYPGSRQRRPTMLVLSRRLNEKLVLPDLNTSIQVVSLTPNAVALGVEAPQEVRILREEVPDRRTEWAVTTDTVSPLLLIEINQMLQKRL